MFTKYSQADIDNAFNTKNKQQLHNIKKYHPNRFSSNCNYYLDIATDSGNEDMAKFLVSEMKCQPSLYAVQMCEVNGHKDLSDWMKNNTTVRNNTSIEIVHKRYNKENGLFEWNSSIPEKYRS